MRQDKGKITVYYDGACPACIKDRHHYEKLAGSAGKYVRWFARFSQGSIASLWIGDCSAVDDWELHRRETRLLENLTAGGYD